MAESVSFDWDSVPDFHLDGRSKVPFADPDPEGTARMWEAWNKEREARTARRAEVVDEDAPDEVYKNHEAPIITQEAEEFDEPISPLAAYVKLAHQSGWTLVEIAHARCTAKGKLVKTGARAGEPHPDRDIETQWIKIEKAGVGRAIVSYTIINGKSNSCYRSFNTIHPSDAEMKAMIKQ